MIEAEGDGGNAGMPTQRLTERRKEGRKEGGKKSRTSSAKEGEH